MSGLKGSFGVVYRGSVNRLAAEGCELVITRSKAVGGMARSDDNARVGRRKHPFGTVQRPATRYTAGAGIPFGEAARELEINSDKKLAAILGNRVVPGTIRGWRNGRRKPPFWALLALAEECDRRSGAIMRATNWLTLAKKEAAEAAS